MEQNKDTIEKSGNIYGKHGRFIDTIAKIICVLGAFALWFYVMQTDTSEYEDVLTEVPINLVNSDYIENSYNLSVYSGYGNCVDVKVVGQKSVVTKLTADDIKIYADLYGITESGVYSLDIKAELPSSVRLEGLSYNTISVYVDTREVKQVDVKADIVSISVPSQYEIGKLELSFSTVTVTGPKTALDSVSHAAVHLSLGSVSGSTKAIGQLELVDLSDNKVNNPYVSISRSEVTVNVPIYTYKTVPFEYSFKYGYLTTENSDISVYPTSIMLKGDPAVLETINSIQLNTIDERQLETNDITLTQPISLPDGVTSAEGVETVTVSVHLRNLITKTYTLTKISVMGNEVPYTLIDKKTTVTIRAPKEIIDDIDVEKVYVILDLSGMTPSTTYIMEVEGRAVFPSEFKNLYVFAEPTVKVQFN